MSQARERLRGATLSIGVTTGHGRAADPEALLERADRALYASKRRGGDQVVCADDLGDEDVPTAPLSKVRALRRMVAEADVGVAFQPIVDLDRSGVLGYEALARPRELHGLTHIGEAFDVAERIGRGHELDAICRAAALRHAAAVPAGTLLFLNVSPQSLEHDTFDGDALVAEVRAAGLQPGDVVLEVSERAVTNVTRVLAEVRGLSALGFHIALDDVGAGNAGLEMLRALHVDYVKIDLGVVQAASAGDRKAIAVLQAILAFAGGVDAYVIAEGIEDETMLAFTRERATASAVATIHGVQGYLLGRPAPLPAEHDAALFTAASSPG